MLSGALIGVGNVAVLGHLPGWRARSDAAIVAACDSRPERREPLARVFPDARWYETAEDLLSQERLDFVDICTPPASHAMLVRQALSRSLHVLCEKPLVLSPEELRGLPALSAEKERALFTVHNWLHAPILAKVTELLRSGAIGEPRRVRWDTLRTQPAVTVGDGENWRLDPAQSGGGILMDHGWHALYILSAWMASAPRTVAARLENRRHADLPVEDTADVFLVYPSATAEIYLTWGGETRANHAEIGGTEGTLKLEGGRLSLHDKDGADVLQEWNLPSLTEGSHHPDWFGGVIESFLGEVLEPRERGRNLGDATLCANVLALAKESSRRGGDPLPVDRMASRGRR
ncbi:MAG: Gfo/Idh/MocA family oxidoreductase [Thermoanaerobaculia bacterium]